ncbi:succinate--CoA ligase ADP-forming subunit beta, mitochondrial [Cinnamomum micranthum f. kanehirae]|uniref:Succinate--CoA ligase ADP-forming subunit beta, mitochondrial n=1 Tax=Cinnamomum micranthum f. kanehirae TaxID=337451 RepID=A0A443NPE0_9MAGN|nr:succinate--CoA ligase ADP-forming subunit beta, mitochondrial [Cinnamomum micranthum f. kanehirae]
MGLSDKDIVALSGGHTLVIIAWRKGGTSIEGTVVKKFPNMINKVHIDVSEGITDEDAASVVDRLAPKLVDRKESIKQVNRLYNLFCDYDHTLLESICMFLCQINPIAETSDGQLITADPKLSFYDKAAFLQKEIVALWDSSHEDPREVAAAEANLNYIGLDGEIGCIVNGAGLAMATMDVIKLTSGTPPVQLKVPVVVRLEGRNVDQGMRILKVHVELVPIVELFLYCFSEITALFLCCFEIIS